MKSFDATYRSLLNEAIDGWTNTPSEPCVTCRRAWSFLKSLGFEEYKTETGEEGLILQISGWFKVKYQVSGSNFTLSLVYSQIGVQRTAPIVMATSNGVIGDSGVEALNDLKNSLSDIKFICSKYSDEFKKVADRMALGASI